MYVKQYIFWPFDNRLQLYLDMNKIQRWKEYKNILLK